MMPSLVSASVCQISKLERNLRIDRSGNPGNLLLCHLNLNAARCLKQMSFCIG